MEQQEVISQEKRSGRPVFLSVLSILSFIALAPLIAIFLYALCFPASALPLVSDSGVDMNYVNRELFILLCATGVVVCGLILWGILLMYFLKWGGFFMFAIPSVILLVIEITATALTGDMLTGIIAFINLFMIISFAIMLRPIRKANHERN
ncbi:MAG: hypothetical protein WCM76_13450 [Bacteroidota bacterium]